MPFFTSLGDEQRQFTTPRWATLIGGARLSIGGHLLLMVPNLEEVLMALFLDLCWRRWRQGWRAGQAARRK